MKQKKITIDQAKRDKRQTFWRGVEIDSVRLALKRTC